MKSSLLIPDLWQLRLSKPKDSEIHTNQLTPSNTNRHLPPFYHPRDSVLDSQRLGVMPFGYGGSSRYESSRSSDWRERRPNDYSRVERTFSTLNNRYSRINERGHDRDTYTSRGGTMPTTSWRRPAASIQTLPAVSRDRESRSHGHVELTGGDRRRSEWAARTSRHNEARDAFMSRSNFNYRQSVPHSWYDQGARMPELPRRENQFHTWHSREPHPDRT